MKKFAMLITLLLSVTVLASCGILYQEETPEENPEETPEENPEDTPEDTPEEEEEGPLVVGMDLGYPPFETEEDGEPYGISVDVAHELGNYLDREVEILDTDFKTLINSLNSGEIDIIIGSMSITEEREQNVDFTDPYFYLRIINLVNQDFADANGLSEDSTISDIEAVNNVEYVGIASQVSYQIPEQRGFDVEEATDLPNAVTEIVQGSKDVLLMSPFPVLNYHGANPGSTMVIFDHWESSPIGMAVRDGDSDLLEDANAFIDQMESGGVYDRLRAEWDDDVQDKLGREEGLDFFINE